MNKMNFKNTEELLEFFNSLDLNESTLVLNKKNVEEKKNDKTDDKEECPCGGTCPCKQEETEKDISESETAKVDLSSFNSICVESFSDNPIFDFEISEDGDENIFYVKDYKSVPNSCGTGEIVLNDRTSHMNMCEMEDKATVELNIMLENKRLNNVPFTLKKTENNEDPYLLISKAHLHQ